jgi:hypothetical protein
MQTLNSNMFCRSVRVRWWECKSEGVAEGEVEDVGADLGKVADYNEDRDKSVENSESWGSKWCDAEEHDAITLYLPRTYENCIITQ